MLGELIVHEVLDGVDFFVLVVAGEGLEIEVDPVGEEEVGGAAVEDEFDQHFVLQVPLQDEVGDYLGDKVLDVVALVVPVDHRVDPLLVEQVVYFFEVGVGLVQLV